MSSFSKDDIFIITAFAMLKCLIIDDAELIRERLKELISETGGVELAGEAKDGAEALKLIEELKPEIIILDIRMPKMNGISLLENMKQGQLQHAGYSEADNFLLKKNKHVPVIIIFSNYLNERYIGRCKMLGADYFFSKSDGLEGIKKIFKELVT